MPKPWRANVVDVLTQNPHFSVRLQGVVVTDGSSRTYYTIHFPGPAVGVVARRGTDVLLVHQYRFIVDEYVWAIPSGAVAPGEPARDAAIRELEEETGYTASDVVPLLECYASYGCSDQQFKIYLASDVREIPEPFDGNEVIETKWFTREELLELIKRNGVVDNLSLSPLLYVLLDDERSRRRA